VIGYYVRLLIGPYVRLGVGGTGSCAVIGANHTAYNPVFACHTPFGSGVPPGCSLRLLSQPVVVPSVATLGPMTASRKWFPLACF
jgi:hypothetical protein